jgi:site-specific DNA-methyltransferase (adenine-specific)
MAVRVIAGDCVRELARLAAAGIVADAVVTDPPYHLTSGNAVYDLASTGSGNPRQRRAVKGGGFMGKTWDGGDIAFRPETWAAIATIMRPGAFLLAFGGTRTHHRLWCAIEDAGFVIQDTIMWLNGQGFPKGRTQLKPAFEPICVAYKPGGKRVLQVDECRIGIENTIRHNNVSLGSSGSGIYGKAGPCIAGSESGRWPANVCHDGSDEVMEAFAAARHSGITNYAYTASRLVLGDDNCLRNTFGYADSGTAARFFYCAKASKADRAGSRHPTIKPIALMRWLVRLVTPPGGLVLDPFAGSGTTGAAVLAEGRNAILIERDAEYIADIRRRLKPRNSRQPSRAEISIEQQRP